MHILYFGCLATNLLDFFINTLLCVAMVTMLAMYILQKVCFCAAGYNLGSMDITLFTLIAYDYLILTFKVKRSAKNTRYFLEFDFSSFVSMVTAEDSGALLFPIGYRQIA